ncbi:MAG: glycoside hydrolase N-terminal domain-containing protein, partial [Kiritimatiellia bacterium]
MKLWYKSPPRDWLEGLPIGTGRLAAMVLGTYKRERIALNHEWLWKGVHRNRDNDVRKQFLPEVRKLLLAGKYEEGTRAANEAFAGEGGLSWRPGNANRKPGRVDSYQPAGDLYLEFNHGCAYDYRRELDLDRAVAAVTYKAMPGKKVTLEYLPHLVEDLILVRVRMDGAPFDCAAWLDRNCDRDCDLSFEASPDMIALNGRFHGAIDFRVQAAIWHKAGECVIYDSRKVHFKQVEEAVFAINIGVSARGKTAQQEC